MVAWSGQIRRSASTFGQNRVILDDNAYFAGHAQSFQPIADMHVRPIVLLLLTALAFSCKTGQSPSKPETPDSAWDEPINQPNLPVQVEGSTEQAAKAAPAWVVAKGPYQAERTKHFDLLRTELDIRLDWAKERVIGQALLRIRPHFYPQDSLYLDAKNFDIHEVAIRKANKSTTPLTFRYDSLVLAVALDRRYSRQDSFEVYVRYTAKPSERISKGSDAITDDKGFYFINAQGTDPLKPRQAWTQGETEANSCWFPTFDSPNFKTTQQISVTVEDSLTTLSNGRLSSSIRHADGTRTDTWRQDLPHAPYLVMLAVGNFAVVKDRWRGKEVSYYVEPAYKQYARDIFGRTPQMMEFFSQRFGVDYPWDKYSQIVVRDFVSGAMENTSASVFMEALHSTRRELIDEDWDDIIAHELAHHWFGDLVTCESWANLPLNESFATYAEYLWAEHRKGRDDADLILRQQLNQYLQEAETKRVPMIRYHYWDKEDMFDSHSYARGGVLLHLLRQQTGDEAFFEALRRYLKKHAFQDTEIHDLRLAFEEVTGQDLNWFFDQWFLKAGYPDLYAVDEYADGKVQLRLSQKQDSVYSTIYRLPMTVDIWTGGKRTRHQILFDQSRQTFEFAVGQQPDLVVVDPEAVFLGQIDHLKTTDEFVLQYRKSERILTRLDALQELASGLKEETPVQELFYEALNDPHWSVREFVADQWREFEGKMASQVAVRLSELALKDPHPGVRSTALQSLSTLGRYPEAMRLALKDSSYAVVSAAISGLVTCGERLSGEQLASLEKEGSIGVVLELANYMSAYRIAGKSGWFAEQTRRQTRGYALAPLLNAWGAYLLNAEKADQEQAVPVLYKIAAEDKRWWARRSAFKALLPVDALPGVKDLLKTLYEQETHPGVKADMKRHL